jgi:predicted phosphoribosyltransferase
MSLPFIDRGDAGRQLADQLHDLRDRPGLIVLGLPRGGVPVAAEVARSLHAPLEALAVRKLGVPGHEELAMGAVASGGIRVLNRDVVEALRIPEAALQRVTAAEQAELARREAAYRDHRRFPELQGKTVVLVDDGIATGATMMAAVQAVQQRKAAAVIVAAPVMALEARLALGRIADGVRAVACPEPFGGVGAWYRDFRPTTDQEVRDTLNRYADDGEPAEVTP